MKNKICILLLENVPTDAEMNIRELKNEGLDFEPFLASNRDEFEKALTEFHPDIILADYRLPDFTGLAALRIVQERNLSAPVIIVTGSLDEETAVDLIKEGAADYVVKQHLVRLGPAVRSALEKRRLSEEKEQVERALREAYRDLEAKVKKRTEELFKSEKAYRDLVENVNSVILTTERNGNITFINNFGLKFFGFSRDELIGKNVVGTIVPETDSTGRDMRKMVEGVMSDPDRYQQSINENIKNTGERIWMSWTNRAIIDDTGKLAGTFTVGNDVTKLKETQRLLSDALKEAKKRADQAEEGKSILDTLMNNISEGIMIADAEGKVRMISAYMARVTGIPQEEAKGKNLETIEAKLSGAEQAANLPAYPIVRALKDCKTILSEERTIHAVDGARMTILINAQPISSADGKVIGALTSWRDITERKKAEDVLRRNEYELRSLVDNSPDLISRMTPQLRYSYVNPAYERVNGLSREQVIGKTNKELGMPQQMVEFWESAVQKVVDSGRENSVEFDMVSFFGKRYFFTRLIPEFAKSGMVESILAITRDITERKRAEEQIRYISFHDEVTGLFNRAFFEEEIHRVDTERNLPISIIMGDVNNLKLNNDVFGHDEGDRLLKAIAESLRKSCRQSDIIARWGGDEFAVILPKTDYVTTDAICARIGQTAKGNTETILPPSIAVGIAVKDNKNQNIYQIVRQAEQNMYDHKFARSKENQDIIISSLLSRARNRTGDYTSHISRSYELARRFGAELGLSETQLKDLHMLIELHDIGSALIPQEILARPRRLNGEEWNIVKKQPEIGFRIVKTFPDTARISDEVLSHCEYWDGSGYTRGLKGKEIPYLARVFLIIDAFDVMTHPRPYARTFTREEAVEELQRNTGKQFDPELVGKFVKNVLKSYY